MGDMWLAAQEAGALEGWLWGAAPPTGTTVCTSFRKSRAGGARGQLGCSCSEAHCPVDGLSQAGSNA